MVRGKSFAAPRSRMASIENKSIQGARMSHHTSEDHIEMHSAWRHIRHQSHHHRSIGEAEAFDPGRQDWVAHQQG